jgi:hypothetical protein
LRLRHLDRLSMTGAQDAQRKRREMLMGKFRGITAARGSRGEGL